MGYQSKIIRDKLIDNEERDKIAMKQHYFASNLKVSDIIQYTFKYKNTAVTKTA